MNRYIKKKNVERNVASPPQLYVHAATLWIPIERVLKKILAQRLGFSSGAKMYSNTGINRLKQPVVSSKAANERCSLV